MPVAVPVVAVAVPFAVLVAVPVAVPVLCVCACPLSALSSSQLSCQFAWRSCLVANCNKLIASNIHFVIVTMSYSFTPGTGTYVFHSVPTRVNVQPNKTCQHA